MTDGFVTGFGRRPIAKLAIRTEVCLPAFVVLPVIKAKARGRRPALVTKAYRAGIVQPA